MANNRKEDHKKHDRVKVRKHVINFSVRVVLEQHRRIHRGALHRSVPQYLLCMLTALGPTASLARNHVDSHVVSSTLAYYSKCHGLTQFIYLFKFCYSEPAV